MPRYDLAGNPLPEDGPAPGAPPPQPQGAPQYDLAGNPIGGGPAMAPPPPGPYPGGPAPGGYPGAAPQPGMRGPMPGPMPGGAPPPYMPQGAPGGYAPPRPGMGGPTFAGGGVDNSDRNKKIFLGVGIGVVVLVLAAVLIPALFPGPVAKPTLSSRWTAKNGAFSVLQPDGWSVRTSENLPGDDNSGPSDVDGVLFRSGSAAIDITSDNAMKNRASNLINSAPGEANDPTAILKNFDNHGRAMTEGSWRGYHEIEELKFDGNGFDGMGHTFTADGPMWGIGGPVKGYRVSLSGDDNTVEVVCTCRVSDWETLKSSFQDVINSIEPGGGRGGGGGLPGLG